MKRESLQIGTNRATQAACHECWWLGIQYTKDAKRIQSPFENTKETIEVKIPEWINDWTYIKFASKGHHWLNGYDGDLYIRIDIQTSSLYSRKWDNLYTKVPVSIFDLVLWWEKQIPHPQGKLKIKIPKATQVWDMVKITWKWFARWWLLNIKWDLFLIPQLEIPKKLSKEAEQLWKDLSKL